MQGKVVPQFCGGRGPSPAVVAGSANMPTLLAATLACTLGLVAAGCSRGPSSETTARAPSGATEAAGAMTTAPGADRATPVPPTAVATSNTLRICGDPGNMPLSNQQREGFQNKIADVLGNAMGMPVTYHWHTYYQRGLARATINADKCDVLMDMTADFEQGLTTTPLYRSTYVLISRKGLALTPTSLDDPKLKTVRIGVFQSSPARVALFDHGVTGVVQYLFYDSASQPQDHPGKLVQDVASGKLDAAESWGPIAGYYAKRDGLTMHPLNVIDDEPLEYSVALAVAKKNVDLRDRMNVALEKSRDQITAILNEYGVPLVKCGDCIVPGTLPSHGPYKPMIAKRLLPESSRTAFEEMRTRLAAGADANVELEQAIVGMDPARIDFLLSHGARANQINALGETPLDVAIRGQQPLIVSQLIKRGADIEAPNKDGWTPLMLAVWNSDTEVANALLSQKAKVDAVAKDGWTPLTLAITYGDSQLVDLLLDAGAPVKQANEKGFTSTMFAVTRKQPAILEVLIKRGADVNRANAAGITPLMMAVASGQEPLVEQLLKAGAKREPRDSEGRTAAQIAKLSGNSALMALLDGSTTGGREDATRQQ